MNIVRVNSVVCELWLKSTFTRVSLYRDSWAIELHYCFDTFCNRGIIGCRIKSLILVWLLVSVFTCWSKIVKQLKNLVGLSKKLFVNLYLVFTALKCDKDLVLWRVVDSHELSTIQPRPSHKKELDWNRLVSHFNATEKKKTSSK